MPMSQAIAKLKNDLIAMCEMCEHALATALMALVDRDTDLACYVIQYDTEIDEMELTIDRQCLELLYSHRLASQDTRFVVAAAKINNDLERIGDLSAYICEHALFLIRERSILSQILDFPEIIEQISQMIRESVEAVLTRDVRLAWKIIDERKIVDEESHILIRELLDLMKKDTRTIERCCHLLLIVQAIHRVADQVSNIAEEVIFLEEGLVVRHHLAEFHPIAMPTQGENREMERIEAEVLRARRPRAAIREEHAEAKRKTRRITREEMMAYAKSAANKLKRSEEKTES